MQEIKNECECGGELVTQEGKELTTEWPPDQVTVVVCDSCHRVHERITGEQQENVRESDGGLNE